MKSAVGIDVFRERQEPSILDLILTNEGGKYQICAMNMGVSDHCLLSFEIGVQLQ